MSKNEMSLQNQGKQSAVQGMASSRQAQEVQAAMVVAKRFPRDEEQAMNKIINACTRQSLAEQATYEYPRGGTKVKGPSIRLAETMARSWGNMDYGIIELEQKDGESEMMAYCWDLETNTRETRIFTVNHIRDTKYGKKKLESARDIYEMTANMGARRMRACILGVIPKYVAEEAVEQSEKTLANKNGQSLEQRIENMVKTFAELGVNQEMLEEKIGCKAAAFTQNDVLKLGRIYRSIQDEMAGVEDFFDFGPEEKSPYDQEDEEPEDDFAKDVEDAIKESGE